MAALLEVEDLAVSYGGIRAVQGISFRVEEGEIATLIGANGAGKSTTLRAISGLVPLERGKIRLFGRDLAGVPAYLRTRLGIAHVPEGRGIFGNLTVMENLLLAAYPRRDREGIRADLERVFLLFPRLKERINQLGGTLSGGEQQMLAVARALMTRGRLILLDEPSMGLAPLLVRSIFGILRDLNQTGSTLLLVEQNANMALHVAHRGYVLESGRIVLEGPASSLAGHPDVKKAYLGG